MIVNKYLANSLLKKCLIKIGAIQIANIHNRSRIGNREWVCFGRAGNASYYDDPLHPCPSIRFKETNNELLALREKEKGDWRKLTIEEKKILYRASFRQTLTEVGAPTGQWKSTVGIVLMLLSVGLWSYISTRLFLYDELPITFSEEYRRAMLRRMLDLKMGMRSGVSSHWDYEADTWKK